VNFAEGNEGEFRSSDKLWHKTKMKGWRIVRKDKTPTC
jgi:hypothetical protein